MEKVVVSIICNAYNHEKYIRQTLESFVMQKTDFPFEILVHDDASTDKTADIIREFEAKYPELVKPICQTENQLSQGKSITKLQYGRAQGKYIAICEGDDYWTDPQKLQKQVDALEAHPEVDICTHAANMVLASTGEVLQVIQPATEDTIIPLEQVILGGGGFVATNSIMYRTELENNVPPFRQMRRLDYMLQIHGSLRGGMLYLHDNMSDYRYMVPGSWTQRVANVDEKFIQTKQKLVEVLKQLNVDTQGRYEETITLARLQQEFAILERQNDLAAMRREPYRRIYQQLTTKRKLSLFVKARLPWLVKLIKRS